MSVFNCRIRPSSLLKTTQVNIIWPDGASKEETPVLYLLHGLTDDYSAWLRWSRIEPYAFSRGFAVVMPDAAKSWYCNQPDGERYYDYISQELPEFVRSTFGIGGDASRCFVAGMSMGGCGALKVGLRNSSNYAAVAAFSISADPEDIHTRHPEIYAGSFGAFPCRPEDDTYRIVNEYPAEGPKPRIYMACGTQDSHFEANVRMRDALKAKGFDIVWDEADFGHVWSFWDIQMQKALDWMIGR